jgi:cell division protein FtsN
MEGSMHMSVIVGASIAAVLALAASTSVARSQGAPKTCSEAHWACTKETNMPAACEAEKNWCIQTGAFAHPKTKALTSGLQKR